MWRTAFLAILAALATSLTGCRADNPTKPAEQPTSTSPIPAAEAPASAPQPSQPTTNDKRPLIVCFGDSLTAGYGTELGKSYPDYLQADLDAKGYHYRVVNEGISGNTTKDGIERVDTIVALKPAVVVVEFGGNDGLRGLPNSATRANLETMVSTLLKGGSKVLLAGITLPPNYGADYIRQFNAIYQDVAAKDHVTLLPMLYDGIYTVPDAIQDDGIHPTAKGAQLLAQHLLPLLLPLLNK
jgi:acyl-CoA thioesterase I